MNRKTQENLWNNCTYKAPPKHNDLQRINELIRSAKTGWLGLLAYLAFIGVTLIGVQDSDFFLVERRTQLPLIGVTIPTTLFFAIAPLLGAMLYTYLHLYLLKLWEALCEIPERINGQPIGDYISPWLVADFALSVRSNSALRPRPLQHVSNIVSFLLIFLATPIVLTAFWWRSMPKHDELLTVIFCGVPLSFTLYAGATSLVRLRNLTQGDKDLPIQGYAKKSMWGGFFFSIGLTGWITTEGTLSHYARQTGLYNFILEGVINDLQSMPADVFIGATARKKTDQAIVEVAEATVDEAWWMQTPFSNMLVSAQLDGVVFVETPRDWLEHDQAYQAYRLEACHAEGLTPTVCGNSPYNESASSRDLAMLRRIWCSKNLPPISEAAGDNCELYFLTLNDRISNEWQVSRVNMRNSLPKRTLSGADLRGANMQGAQMNGIVLQGARMEGVDLALAQMEGADLSTVKMDGATLLQARMEGANLREAQMRGAVLSLAQLSGADLSSARMEKSVLREARLEGSIMWQTRLTQALLWRAQMDGANLSEARLERADLSQSEMENVDLTGAQMQGAILWEASLTGATFFQAKMENSNMSQAELTNADLRLAQLSGAMLWQAQMEGADLTQAHLEGANLSQARMGGAVLWQARMSNVNLSQTRMDRHTFLDAVPMNGAGLKDIDCTFVQITQAQTNEAFGDASVTLPAETYRPDHWPKQLLSSEDFNTEWRKWQADPASYVPPPPRAP